MIYFILTPLTLLNLCFAVDAIETGKPLQSITAFVVQPSSIPHHCKTASSASYQLHPSKYLKRYGTLFHKNIKKIVTAHPTAINQANSDDSDVPLWQTEGENIITNAAIDAGASPDQISIAWKPSRVIVTISGGASEKEASSDGTNTNLVLSTDENDDDDVEIDDLEDIDDDLSDNEEEMEKVKEKEPKGLDLTAIARSINAALDDEEGTVGWHVAFSHEIEVTTPGTSDVLEGKVMFDAYRGFDVIMEGINEKNGKKKVVEGKLVERDDKVTKVNVKGRIVKMKNENVVCVKLPKAKKEKGVR